MQDGKRSSITPERIELLNAIGFAWHAQLAAWDRRLNELMDFKQRHGHCHVPLNNVDPKL
jgi:Helicase associated domain